MLHLSITTRNLIGSSRRHAHLPEWTNLGLSPQYIFASQPHITNERKILQSQKLFLTQLSCTNTHRLAWKRFLLTSNEWCLITEDDAFSCDDSFFLNLDQFVSSQGKSKKAKIFQLGYVVFPKLTFRKLSNAILNIRHYKIMRIRHQLFVKDFNYGTHCYLINRNMGKLLLELGKFGHLGLDASLIGFLGSELGQKLCIVYRKLIPVSLQWRDSSNQDTTQEYFGRKSKRITILETIATLASFRSKSDIFCKIESPSGF